jgi:hypothetical protein
MTKIGTLVILALLGVLFGFVGWQWLLSYGLLLAGVSIVILRAEFEAHRTKHLVDQALDDYDWRPWDH